MTLCTSALWLSASDYYIFLILDDRVQFIDQTDIGKFFSSKDRKFDKSKKEYLYIYIYNKEY